MSSGSALGTPEHDDVAGPDFVTGFGGLPADGDVAVEDQSLEDGSGEIRITVGQEMVEALRAFARRNDNLRPRVNVRHGRIRGEPVTRALASCGARPLFAGGALFPDSPGPLRLPTAARRARAALRPWPRRRGPGQHRYLRLSRRSPPGR